MRGLPSLSFMYLFPKGTRIYRTNRIRTYVYFGSCCQWFQSQTANIDVREIDTHLRAALYKVGSKADINDLDIWGKTFVTTNDLSVADFDPQSAPFLSFVSQQNVPCYPQSAPFLSAKCPSLST